MNTRKLRWLSIEGQVINLDNVNFFRQTEEGVEVYHNGQSHTTISLLRSATIDDIRHYLKYGKPKKR